MSTIYANLRSANVARQKLWSNPDMPLDLTYRTNELAGEAGETCNIVKKLERERRGMVGSRATKDQLLEELADVIICVDLVVIGQFGPVAISLDHTERLICAAFAERSYAHAQKGAKELTDKLDLTFYGNALAAAVGKVCLYAGLIEQTTRFAEILPLDDYSALAGALQRTVRAACDVAAAAGIGFAEFRQAIALKFNGTSKKVDLPIEMLIHHPGESAEVEFGLPDCGC